MICTQEINCSIYVVSSSLGPEYKNHPLHRLCPAKLRASGHVMPRHGSHRPINHLSLPMDIRPSRQEPHNRNKAADTADTARNAPKTKFVGSESLLQAPIAPVADAQTFYRKNPPPPMLRSRWEETQQNKNSQLHFLIQTMLSPSVFRNSKTKCISRV
ncbi:hypothetical protein VTK56DRAFT_2705 [Thermocarpiscus australiensis]